MSMIELLHDAVVQDRERSLAEGLRHCQHDVPRRSLLARWRDRRAGRAAASTAGLPDPARTRSSEASVAVAGS